jgi:hypothetical protein
MIEMSLQYKKGEDMSEQIKDYERLERERWEESALICPARKGPDCVALITSIQQCGYLSCWGRFCALQFGQRP